ncbi:hypothetical protein JCM3770_001204 [Rhodotorula araucariae]
MGSDSAAPAPVLAPALWHPQRCAPVSPSVSDADSDADRDGEKPPTTQGFRHFRHLVRRVLSSPRTEWTIIVFAVIDFVFCFLQIAWLILRDPECECRGTCDEDEPAWLHWLDITSLLISGIFVFEIPFDVIGFGLEYYTTMRYHWLHLVDTLVILIAFVLEVMLEGIARPLTSLLTILRLWRVVKLVSTAEIGVVDYHELTLHAEERAMWARERARMHTALDAFRKRLQRYEGEWSEKHMRGQSGQRGRRADSGADSASGTA